MGIGGKSYSGRRNSSRLDRTTWEQRETGVEAGHKASKKTGVRWASGGSGEGSDTGCCV